MVRWRSGGWRGKRGGRGEGEGREGRGGTQHLGDKRNEVHNMLNNLVWWEGLCTLISP